jgi:LPS export ABC transporter protein LptC
MKRGMLLVLSVALFSMLFFMIKGERGSKSAILQKGESFIEGLRLVHRQNGNIDWILTARRADITDKGDKAFLSGIEMQIENKGITMSADKGTYDMTARDLTVDGRVVAKGDSYSIISDHVKFDGGSGRLEADGGVEIKARKFTVAGSGMDADSAGQKVKIRKDVKAIFYY